MEVVNLIFHRQRERELFKNVIFQHKLREVKYLVSIRFGRIT